VINGNGSSDHRFDMYIHCTLLSLLSVDAEGVGRIEGEVDETIL
jgi:hypothetical protein